MHLLQLTHDSEMDCTRSLCEKIEAPGEGFPHLTLHGLRHAHATLALTAGVNPKVVSERLGHSTIAVTMDTYSHVLPGMQEEAPVAVEKLLKPSK
jgi:integrase